MSAVAGSVAVPDRTALDLERRATRPCARRPGDRTGPAAGRGQGEAWQKQTVATARALSPLDISAPQLKTITRQIAGFAPSGHATRATAERCRRRRDAVIIKYTKEPDNCRPSGPREVHLHFLAVAAGGRRAVRGLAFCRGRHGRRHIVWRLEGRPLYHSVLPAATRGPLTLAPGPGWLGAATSAAQRQQTVL